MPQLVRENSHDSRSRRRSRVYGSSAYDHAGAGSGDPVRRQAAMDTARFLSPFKIRMRRVEIAAACPPSTLVVFPGRQQLDLRREKLHISQIFCRLVCYAQQRMWRRSLQLKPKLLQGRDACRVLQLKQLRRRNSDSWFVIPRPIVKSPQSRRLRTERILHHWGQILMHSRTQVVRSLRNRRQSKFGHSESL